MGRNNADFRGYSQPAPKTSERLNYKVSNAISVDRKGVADTKGLTKTLKPGPFEGGVVIND